MAQELSPSSSRLSRVSYAALRGAHSLGGFGTFLTSQAMVFGLHTLLPLALAYLVRVRQPAPDAKPIPDVPPTPPATDADPAPDASSAPPSEER